jgi:4-hydroxyphenylacetate 3-monooxygenase
MLKTGAEHLRQLKDGRTVYIGSEKVDDVTTHPAFRNAAHTVAGLYDLKNSPALSYEESGERFSAYFLKARTKDDLVFRSKIHRAIAAATHGLLGRSPDHVASFVTGMAMNAPAFGDYAPNLLRYYEHMRKDDVYAAYAVVPPQAARNPEFYVKQNLPVPTLRVVREGDDGVVISGMKMLATGAVFANEIWIGNLIPLAPSQLAESITCAVPVNAPGLALWSRKPFERHAPSEFDNPLTWRFDESDSMVMCEEVKVPWEKVFVHRDAVLARDVYIKTPGHCYGNHQSNVRFHAKMQLIVGLASKIAAA